MSQANVEAFKRGVDAYNRGDVEAFLDELDPEVEWRDAIAQMLGGDAAVYQRHQGARECCQDLSDAFADLQSEYSEVRDLGGQTIAIGRVRARGEGSGAEIEIAANCKFQNGKAIRIRTYLDPNEALEAAGLRE